MQDHPLQTTFMKKNILFDIPGKAEGFVAQFACFQTTNNPD